MITVRTVESADLQVVHDMAEVVFRQTYKDILSPEQMEYMMEMMYSLPNLNKQLEDGHHYYLASDGEDHCGYVSVQYQEQDGEIKVFHLHKIYVMPQWQGKGIGKLLFDHVVTHVMNAKGESPARIELNVNRYNKAVDFYRHLGMQVLLEEDFPIGNGFYKTDYIMGLNLPAR